jgi:hypothetical protein
MSRRRHTYRPPPVLEIGEPIGNTPESIMAREEFHAQRVSAELQVAVDRRLDNLMRGLWTDAAYWADKGMKPPPGEYPGLEAIRTATRH